MGDELSISAEQLKAAGIQPGSKAEKAVLVDIAYAAREYHNHPEKYKDVASLNRLLDNTVDGKNGANPFGTDPSTNQLLKNYAHALVDRSVAIDKKRGKTAGTSAKDFLVKTSDILNHHKTLDGHEMLIDDKHIEDTVQKAAKGVKGGILRTLFNDPKAGLTQDEAKDLAVELTM